MDRKKVLNDELEAKATNLEQEFEQYKIRAQSVLKQVKEKDSAIGEKAQELASLERVVQNLNAKIADLRYNIYNLHFFLKKQNIIFLFQMLYVENNAICNR